MDLRLNKPRRGSCVAQRFFGERRRETPGKAENPIGRDKDDDEENRADQSVEAIGADDIDREGLQKHIKRRAEKWTDRMPQAADHGDDQHANDLADADRSGRNPTVEPHVQHARTARDEASEEELLLVAAGKMRIPKSPLKVDKLLKISTGSVAGSEGIQALLNDREDGL